MTRGGPIAVTGARPDLTSRTVRRVPNFGPACTLGEVRTNVRVA